MRFNQKHFEVNLFISMIGINVWIVIKLWHGFIIGLACMSCLHCTCMQLFLHICMLNAALNAECHILTCGENVPLSTTDKAVKSCFY